VRCSEPKPDVYNLINAQAKAYRCKVSRICYQRDEADVTFQTLRNKNESYEIVVALDGERNVVPALLEELKRRHRLGIV